MDFYFDKNHSKINSGKIIIFSDSVLNNFVGFATTIKGKKIDIEK